MKRAALYMRISTKGHGQTTDTQAVALRDYAQHRGFQVIDEYRDEGISGAKDRRPELDRMMADARRRRFDAVLVARFDRFARSTKHLVLALRVLQPRYRLHQPQRVSGHINAYGKDGLHGH